MESGEVALMMRMIWAWFEIAPAVVYLTLRQDLTLSTIFRPFGRSGRKLRPSLTADLIIATNEIRARFIGSVKRQGARNQEVE
jgi:hypothetical protein